ncbi:MAG: hypothetical protein C5B44_06175 [Acidobacteria bacterium]|nr:MAG: hypothetical protein C5B44_06175 [Acidobacteriota bacterium]
MDDFDREELEKARRSLGLLGQLADEQSKSQKKEQAAREKLTENVKGASSALKALSGSATEAQNLLYKLHSKWLGVGFVIAGLVHSAKAVAGSFNAVTKSGITFGGSLFEMQLAAGKSQLSLEEFAKTMTSSSTVIATMGDTQKKGIKDFSDYQLAVRKNLAPFGLFGMTIDEINGITSDYAETLRVQGIWGQMDANQRQRSATNFIEQINQLAAATGKTREAIAKQANEMLRKPATALAMQHYTAAQQEAIKRLTTAMGAMAPELGGAISDMVASGGNLAFTEFGQQLIQVGAQPLMDALNSLFQDAIQGNEDDASVFDRLQRARMLMNDRALQALAYGGNASAAIVQKALVQLQGYEAQMQKMRENDAAGKWDDAITNAVMNFEKDFHSITGKFREGIFGAIVEMLPGKTNQEKMESYQKLIASTGDLMGRFGVAFGKLIGVFLEHLPEIVSAFEWFVDKVLGLQNWFEGISKKFLGTSDKWSSFTGALGTIGTLFAGWKIGKWLLGGIFRSISIDARTVYVNAKKGLLGDLLTGGGGGAGGGGKRGIFRRGLGAIRRGTGALLQGGWNLAGRGVGGLWRGMQGIFGPLLRGGGNLAGRGFTNLLTGMRGFFGPMLRGAGSLAGRGFTGLLSGMRSIFRPVLRGAGTTGGSLLRGAMNLLTGMKSTLSELVRRGLSAGGGLLRNSMGLLSNMKGMFAGVARGTSGALSATKSVIGGILRGGASLGGSLLRGGLGLLRGGVGATGGLLSGAGGVLKGGLGAAGGLLKWGGKALVRGGLWGIGSAIVESIAGSVIDQLPVGQKAKDSMSAALAGAGWGATAGSFVGPWGTVVGGLLGAIGGLVVENWPSKQETIDEFTNMLSPKAKETAKAAREKINELNQELVLKQQAEAAAIRMGAAPEDLKSRHDETVRLQQQLVEQQDCLIRLQKQNNELLENARRAQLGALQ